MKKVKIINKVKARVTINRNDKGHSIPLNPSKSHLFASEVEYNLYSKSVADLRAAGFVAMAIENTVEETKTPQEIVNPTGGVDTQKPVDETPVETTEPKEDVVGEPIDEDLVAAKAKIDKEINDLKLKFKKSRKEEIKKKIKTKIKKLQEMSKELGA